MPFRSLINHFKYRKNPRIAIYGPPNTGKTSLANRFIADFTKTNTWEVSDIPYETREVQEHKGIEIKRSDGKKLRIDLYDMPAISSKGELHKESFDEFLKSGMSESEALIRLMEATKAIKESVKHLKKVDNAVVVLDSTKNPYNAVNITLLRVLKANRVNVVVAANKSDLTDSDSDKTITALGDYPVIPVSCKEGTNLDCLYQALSDTLD